MDKKSVGKVIAHIARNGARYIEKHIKQYDLGFGQFQIVMELQPLERIKQDELVKRVCVDKTTIARTIKKLETLKYIKRKQHPDDSRAYEISLTKRGEEVREGVHKVLQSYTKQLLKGFDEEDEKLVLSLLGMILENSNEMEQL